MAGEKKESMDRVCRGRGEGGVVQWEKGFQEPDNRPNKRRAYSICWDDYREFTSDLSKNSSRGTLGQKPRWN